MVEVILIVAVDILAVMVVLFIAAKSLSKHTFECRACGRRARLDWKTLILCAHYGNEYRAECQECGKRCMLDLDNK